jgi:cytoskeletal protein CcmA (bactofilin family)
LEIDGKVRGNIRCLSLKLGEKSIVHGDIVAEKVEVHGEVLGNITAKKIICGATAKVRGNILHSTIHIENGAHVDGSCRKFIPPAIVYEPADLIENQESLVVAEQVSAPVAEPVPAKPREPEIHQDEILYFGVKEREGS